MERIAGIIEERRDDLAQTLTLDQGKPLKAEAYDEVDELVEYFRMASADATRLDGLMPPSVDADKRVFLYRVPCGVVAGIFNLITGRGSVVGDEVAANPGTQAVAFIGSVETGNRVAQRAAGKALLLEMGGNGPMVILDDADIDAVAQESLTSAFLGAGQSCTAGERFLVHERVYDSFLDGLGVAMEREVRLGDPFASDTTLGPLNNEPTAEKMDQHVSDALERGAELLAGGARAKGFPTDLYYRPTVLGKVTAEMRVSKEETFGPVVPATVIRDEEEAIRAVNSSPYGLLSAVFTRDLARGLRFAEKVRTGWVNINTSSNHWESHLPFGGRAGSRSGIGRVGGRYPMETFTEFKTVILTVG